MTTDSELVSLWLNTRRNLECIDDKMLDSHSMEILDILNVLRNVVLKHVLRNPTAIEKSALIALNDILTSNIQNEESELESNTEHDTDQTNMNIMVLPDVILVHITSFLQIQTITQWKTTCILFRSLLLDEIKKRNVCVKIMKEPSNVHQIHNSKNISFCTYRLAYNTTFEYVMDKFEADFQIPQKYQLMIVEPENEFDKMDIVCNKNEIIYNEFDKYNIQHKRIPKDLQFILIDTRKFQQFIPTNVASSKSNSLRPITFKYVDLLFKTIEIDNVLTHKDFARYLLNQLENDQFPKQKLLFFSKHMPFEINIQDETIKIGSIWNRRCYIVYIKTVRHNDILVFECLNTNYIQSNMHMIAIGVEDRVLNGLVLILFPG
eukprot:511372_1